MVGADVFLFFILISRTEILLSLSLSGVQVGPAEPYAGVAAANQRS